METSSKRSKLILHDEILSEEEGASGPTSVMEGNSNLLIRIAELEQEKVDMAQQLECQLALIKQLQQQLLNQQRQQRKQQRQEKQQKQRQRQPEEDNGMCLEVIIQEEEGDPFNFVQRRKKSNRPKVSERALPTNPQSSTQAATPRN